MAGHHLIDAYVDTLAARLPADTVDELADGLIQAWRHHTDRGLAPEAAAQAAIAEFGDADRVVDEFVHQAPGRRTARLLLGTGPIFGVCWGTGLVTAKVWTWPIPLPVGAVYACVLLAAVAALLTAATSRHSYRRTQLGTGGALALATLDTVMIATVAILAPALVWPMAVALLASLTRIGYTAQAVTRPQPA